MPRHRSQVVRVPQAVPEGRPAHTTVVTRRRAAVVRPDLAAEHPRRRAVLPHRPVHRRRDRPAHGQLPCVREPRRRRVDFRVPAPNMSVDRIGDRIKRNVRRWPTHEWCVTACTGTPSRWQLSSHSPIHSAQLGTERPKSIHRVSGPKSRGPALISSNTACVRRAWQQTVAALTTAGVRPKLHRQVVEDGKVRGLLRGGEDVLDLVPELQPVDQVVEPAAHEAMINSRLE